MHIDREKDQPLVTIVIPCYNGERFIARCLSSIERQTYNRLEVLLIDDGSQDQSTREVKKYPFARVVSNGTNQGVSYSRNHGLEEACGKYIHFLDVDDEVNSTFYERLVHNAELSGAEVTAAGFIYQEFPEKSHLFRRHRVVTDPLDRLMITFVTKICCVWRYLFRTDFIRSNLELRFPVGQLAEDLYFSVRALYYADKVATAPGAEYLYRYEPHSIVHKDDPQARRALEEGERKSREGIIEFLRERGLEKALGSRFFSTDYVLNKIRNYLRGCPTDLTERH